MRFEVGLLAPPEGAGQRAKELEDLGLDGTFSFEGPHGPFLPLALAAASTATIGLSTAIAVAFARNPMTIAQDAQDVQRVAQGRFTLGLGTQIKPHIERRFSMPWSDPVDRLREFVAAVRTIWGSWRTGEPLAFEGDFYRHTLMSPFFVPPDHGFGDPAILLAGVGARMVEAAGEVADGLLVHPFHSASFLAEDTLPAFGRGVVSSGRARGDVQITCQTMVMIGRDDAEVAAARGRARAQLAFYGSTPAYRGVLDHHGMGELQPELRTLTREGRWGDLAVLVPDELVDAIGVSGSPDEVVSRLRDRNAFADSTALVLYDGTADGSGLGQLMAAVASTR